MFLVNCKLTTLRISYGNGSIVTASRPDRYDPAVRVPSVFIRSRTGSGVRLDATPISHCTYNVKLSALVPVAYRGVWGVGVFNPPPPPEILKISVESSIAQARRTGVSISFCSSLCSHTVVNY